MKRCAPTVIDGTTCLAQTSGPLTQLDIDALTTFHRILQEQHVTNPTQPSPNPTPPGAVDLAAVKGWYEVLERVAEKRAELDKVEKKAREHIEPLMGDAVDGYLDGKHVVRYSHVAGRRTFQGKQFAKDHPDLSASYTKVGEPGRRFQLVEPTGGDQ